MKKFFKKCFIFTLVTLIFCSCSGKGVKIEQLSGKYFVTKEKAFIIEKTKDDESSSDSKKISHGYILKIRLWICLWPI